MDKGGNFIGWLHVESKNLSVLLVEEGLSTVHFTAESSKFYQQLTSAQESAKSKNLHYWSTYVEEEKDEKVSLSEPASPPSPPPTVASLEHPPPFPPLPHQSYPFIHLKHSLSCPLPPIHPSTLPPA